MAGGDGSAGSAGASGCVSTCDCDGDLQAGPQCSGPDCVDNDPLVFQGQGGWFGVANAAGGFDYNCDTNTDKEFQNVTCPGLLSALDCNNKPEGYLVDKPCGEMTDWGDCTWNGLALKCEPNTKQNKQVRCH